MSMGICQHGLHFECCIRCTPMHLTDSQIVETIQAIFKAVEEGTQCPCGDFHTYESYAFGEVNALEEAARCARKIIETRQPLR